MTSSKWDIHGMHITGIEDEQYDNMSGVWKWVTHLIVCQNQGLTASCFGKMRDWHQWNILVEHFNIHHLVYKYHTLCICHNIYIYTHAYIIYPIIHTHTYIPWYSHKIPILMFSFTALRDGKKRPQGRAANFWRGVEEGGIVVEKCAGLG